MDTSPVKNNQATDFLIVFFKNRRIYQEFYQRVPKDKFDYRMVDTNKRKSDSVRESLAHQIAVQQTYLKAVKRSRLNFGKYQNKHLKNQAKITLLKELTKADQALIDTLANEKLVSKNIRVPWNQKPISVVDMF